MNKKQLISKVYAKALYQLDRDENIIKSFTSFQELINSNGKLEALLFLDIFSIFEKQKVLEDILNMFKISSTLKTFILFLNKERRLGILPLIYKEIIEMDDRKKGFIVGTVESPTGTISDKLQKGILEYLKSDTKKIKINNVKNKSMIAGCKITVDGLQLDASLKKQLDNFKKQILN